MEMKWISIEEKLPPQGVYVLVSLNDIRKGISMNFTQIAERYNKDWYSGHDGESLLKKPTRKVTHWMPLPDEPKMEIS